jgi:hypothetical protein
MVTHSFVSKVCELPLVAGAHANASMAALLDQLRRDAGRNYPTEAEVLAELQETPQLVQSWQQLSEDQRTSQGWYLRRTEGGDAWEVGFYPTSATTVYLSAEAAAAAFIVRYIGFIAIRS